MEKSSSRVTVEVLPWPVEGEGREGLLELPYRVDPAIFGLGAPGTGDAETRLPLLKSRTTPG